MPGMIYETSKLHPINGITYRGKDLYEIRDSAPRAPGGSEPIPEGVLWLLLTGEFPSESELKAFQEELYQRGRLTDEQETLIKSFPKDMHPMTQLSAGILACQPGSKFAKAYHEGIHKSKYWDPTYEDALDVCAKVSRIAALIFHNCYKDVRFYLFLYIFRSRTSQIVIQISTMVPTSPTNSVSQIRPSGN